MKEMGDAEDESEGDDDDDDDDDDVLDEPQHLHEQPWSTLLKLMARYCRKGMYWEANA
jgi:hypothetical protein